MLLFMWSNHDIFGWEENLIFIKIIVSGVLIYDLYYIYVIGCFLGFKCDHLLSFVIIHKPSRGTCEWFYYAIHFLSKVYNLQWHIKCAIVHTHVHIHTYIHMFIFVYITGSAEEFIGWPRYSWNVGKWGLLFNIVPLMLHILLSLVLQCLDPIGQKVANSRYDDIIWTFQPTLMCVRMYIYIYIYIYILNLFFIIQCMKTHVIPCPHQPPTRGNATVLIAMVVLLLPPAAFATGHSMKTEWKFLFVA